MLVAGPRVAPGDPVRILVVGTSDGDAGPARTLVTAASVPALLAAATPKAELPGRVLRVADSGGLVLAESTGPFDPSALPGEVLDLATMAAHDSDGRTEINLPGIEGWHVVVAAPIPLIEMPVQALAALGAMLVLLVVFTMWMARQILRPARALEDSRSRLHELYESAREAALRDSLTGSATTARSGERSPGWSRARGATARASRWCSWTSTSSSGSTTRRVTRPATCCSRRSGR